MHDLSKAEEVVAKIIHEAEKNDELKEVIITLGIFSFIDPQRFEYWVNNLLEEQGLLDLRITVKSVPGVAKCTSCGSTFNSDQLMTQLKSADPHHPVLLCPQCHKPTLDVESGTEVELSFH